MKDTRGQQWPNRHVLIAQRLRERRADLGLTQQQVVTRLAGRGLHMTNRALSSLEHGAGVDVAKLPELALALDCTVTYLLALTANPHRWEPDDVRPEPTPSRSTSGPKRSASLIISSVVPERVIELGEVGRERRE